MMLYSAGVLVGMSHSVGELVGMMLYSSGELVGMMLYSVGS